MKKKRSKSIRRRLLVPLLILLIFQAVVIAGTVLLGGVSRKLKNNEVHILSNYTENTKLRLEENTVNHWVGILHDSESVATDVQTVLDGQEDLPRDIFSDHALNRKIVEKTIGNSIEILQRSDVTGVFLVLNGPAAKYSSKEPKAGFYVRKTNTGGILREHSALLLERGLPSIAQTYNIPLSTYWKPGYTKEDFQENSDFFKKPYQLALENKPDFNEAMNFSYMSHPFSLSPGDKKVITYSIPVILEDGTTIGVFGLELSLNQIQHLMSEILEKESFESCWVLGIRQKGTEEIEPVSHMGDLYESYFKENQKLSYTKTRENINKLKSSDGTMWYASIKNLNVYENYRPFAGEEWVVVGLARKSDLLSFYHEIRYRFLFSLVFPLVLSLLGVVIIGKIVTDPIRMLVKKLNEESKGNELLLNTVHIKEIDELTETIQRLNGYVNTVSSKFSNILHHANVLIGVFEYVEGENKVFCSKSLFEMLGWGELTESYCYMNREEFESRMEVSFHQGEIKGNRIRKCLNTPSGIRWVELTIEESKNGIIIGVCLDVTGDEEEKVKLERERNYDQLTNLYNRRAFREQVIAILKGIQKDTAAMVMWDLDNLKYINDTYGHDKGDSYIVLFADCLKYFELEKGIVCRYSGDEFVTFLTGKNKEEIRKKIQGFMKYIQKCTLHMNGGYRFPVRVSGGLSWFPDNASEYDNLFNYADFAMYMVKHSVKGIVKEFDRNEYTSNSYMLSGSEELNRMLDKKEVRFAFQPIVTREGKIYGYELLMRPEFTNMKGILEVLNLARAQAKLKQMEVLTWFAGLHAAQMALKEKCLGTDEKLFINSIASVCISKEEQRELEERYGSLLDRVVIEMTEGEPANQDYLQKKIDIANQWKAMTAVDDFGTGYNSQAVLLRMQPDIVKIDRSLVKHIHEDSNRQIIVSNLLKFSRQNDICVLAEGVETVEELEYLMNCGVSLFQGYYIARPQREIRPLDSYIVQKMLEFSSNC